MEVIKEEECKHLKLGYSISPDEKIEMQGGEYTGTRTCPDCGKEVVRYLPSAMFK